MNQLDKQGRLHIPKGLRDLSDAKDVEQIVVIHVGGMIYRIIPMDNIPSDAKILYEPQKFDTKGRLFVPKALREQYMPKVQVFVQGAKLYFEFEAQKNEE